MTFAKLPLIALFTAAPLLALAEPMPFNDENWTFLLGTSVEPHEGQESVLLGVPAEGAPFGVGIAIPNIAPFTNGIIKYDVDFGAGSVFAGLRFRVQGQGDFEDFYMRGHQSGNPDSNQYMAQYNGVPSWELYYGPRYSAPTVYNEGWNQIKLAISGDLMDVFINDMETPAFTTVLLREEQTGGLAFWGFNIGEGAWFANVDIEPMAEVEIVGTPVPQIAGPEGTVTEWQVSTAFDGASLVGKAMLDKADTMLDFTPMQTQITGMLDLARLQGISEGKDTAFARVTITADSDMTKAFEFGFSDAAQVYLNGEAIFRGEDWAYSRDYRFLGTVGFYDTLFLNLKAGENELMIAVSENVADPTGWAVQGRFADLEGISLK